MNVVFKTYKTVEERKDAFMKMVHAKEVWEARMQELMAQQNSMATV